MPNHIIYTVGLRQKELNILICVEVLKTSNLINTEYPARQMKEREMEGDQGRKTHCPLDEHFRTGG